MLFRLAGAAIFPEAVAVPINGQVENFDLWYNHIIKGFFKYKNSLNDYLIHCVNDDTIFNLSSFCHAVTTACRKSKRFCFDFLLLLLSLHDNRSMIIFNEAAHEIMINVIERFRDQRACFFSSGLSCSLNQDNASQESYNLIINETLIVIKQSSLLDLKDKLLEASIYLLSRRRLPITHLI